MELAGSVLDVKTQTLMEGILAATKEDTVISDWSSDIDTAMKNNSDPQIPAWASGVNYNIDEAEDEKQALDCKDISVEEYLRMPSAPEAHDIPEDTNRFSTIYEVDEECGERAILSLNGEDTNEPTGHIEGESGTATHQGEYTIDLGQINRDIKNSIQTFIETGKRHPDILAINPKLFMQNAAIIWGNSAVRGRANISPISFIHLRSGISHPIKSWFFLGMMMASFNKKGKPTGRAFFVPHEQIMAISQKDMQNFNKVKHILDKYKEDTRQSNIFIVDITREIVLNEKMKQFGVIRSYALCVPKYHHLFPSSSLNTIFGQVQSGNIRMHIGEREVIEDLNAKCIEYNLSDLPSDVLNGEREEDKSNRYIQDDMDEDKKRKTNPTPITLNELRRELDSISQNQTQFQEIILLILKKQEERIDKISEILGDVLSLQQKTTSQGEIWLGASIKAAEKISQFEGNQETYQTYLLTKIMIHLRESEQRIIKELCHFKTNPVRPEIPTPNLLLRRALETMTEEMSLHPKENLIKWNPKITEIVESKDPERINKMVRFMIQERNKY
ncbi:putative phosphoprotein [Sunshine Coast virus]|uniref:Putative phosphoprotein n=1 Tax=Sunshine Coast virus TaxID=1195087 RepID=I3VIY9_9MONO|nr:putative phosphoprotein [Sunshine Coast virus]AFK79806.1 putative phosphoprotein [Sunshine Coast virus]